MATPEKRMPRGNEADAEDRTEHPDSTKTPAPPPQRTTSAERAELSKVLGMRRRVAHADAKARAADQMALFEQQLATEYPESHPAWSAAIAKARLAIEAAQVSLAAECDALGIPPMFRPRFECYWNPRGQNAIEERRNELRKVAQAFVTANCIRACTEVDRTVASLQTQLLGGAVLSSDGRSFLDCMPSIDALLPAPTLDVIKQIAEG